MMLTLAKDCPWFMFAVVNLHIPSNVEIDNALLNSE